MIDLIAGRYTVRAGFGAAFDADNVGGNMLGLGISLTRANLGVSVRSFDFTTGTLPAGVTFTRAGTATYFDANGMLQTAAADVPRFDHDPVTKAPKGLLIEGIRTNLLLNSPTLATQSVTTAAQSYTLTFYGTGSVALSGAYTGSLAGTGASDRVKLTFTAAAGTLTLTVTGSVTQAQLEAGAFASSYIPTTSAAVTRAADTAVMTGADFSRWFNPVEGTIVAEYSSFSSNVADRYPLTIARAASVTDRIDININAAGVINPRTVVGGAAKASLSPGNYTQDAVQRVAFGYKVGSYAASLNGAAVATSANADALPTDLARMILGSLDGSGGILNGHLRRILGYPRRLDNSRIQQLAVV